MQTALEFGSSGGQNAAHGVAIRQAGPGRLEKGVHTLKEVGVPLTGMGREAATLLEPAIGNGAASPALSHTRKVNHTVPATKLHPPRFPQLDVRMTASNTVSHCVQLPQVGAV